MIGIIHLDDPLTEEQALEQLEQLYPNGAAEYEYFYARAYHRLSPSEALAAILQESARDMQYREQLGLPDERSVKP